MLVCVRGSRLELLTKTVQVQLHSGNLTQCSCSFAARAPLTARCRDPPQAAPRTRTPESFRRQPRCARQGGSRTTQRLRMPAWEVPAPAFLSLATGRRRDPPQAAPRTRTPESFRRQPRWCARQGGSRTTQRLRMPAWEVPAPAFLSLATGHRRDPPQAAPRNRISVPFT